MRRAAVVAAGMVGATALAAQANRQHRSPEPHPGPTRVSENSFWKDAAKSLQRPRVVHAANAGETKGAQLPPDGSSSWRFVFGGPTKTRKLCADLYNQKFNGAHDDNDDQINELGRLMKELKEQEHGDQFDRNKASRDWMASLHMKTYELLQAISEIRGVNIEDFKDQYSVYLNLIMAREDTARRAVSSTHVDNPTDRVELPTEDIADVWGSRRQLVSGKVVADMLASSGTARRDLDPVFGALLNPTGGVVGPRNIEFFSKLAAAEGANKHRGWVSKLFSSIVDKEVLTMHGAVHDAAGYLYNYHKVGPGFSYTGSSYAQGGKPQDPMSGQVEGLALWFSIIKAENPFW